MNTREAYSAALQKRRQLQDEVRAIGIDEAFIDRLVDTFYTKVQADPSIGYVFNNVIQDNWPVHLAKMKTFWRSVVLRTGEYDGKPIPTHQRLEKARPEHFNIWLKLFEETLIEIAPNDAVRHHFMARAHQMANRLSTAMFSEQNPHR